MSSKARGGQAGSTVAFDAGKAVLPPNISGGTSSVSLGSMDDNVPAPTEESGALPPIPAVAPDNDVKPRTRGSSEPRTPVAATPQQQEQRFGKRGSGQAFALGLFQILKTEDPSIIGWSASGKAFRIGDSDRFCTDIMPRFFKQNKYSSFQRQLNLYGFRKLVRGNEAGGYMHPLFERGKPEQLSQVRRGYFPDIPPEFAHDVHGHGLGETTDASGPSATGTPSRAVPRGRKVDSQGQHLGGSGGGSNGPMSGDPNDHGGSGTQRSSSVGRPSRSSGTLAAISAATAAVAAAAVPGNGARGVLNGKAGVSGRGYPPGGGSGGGVGGQGRVIHRQEHGLERSGSASVVVGPHGLMGDGGVETDWEGVAGPLPSLDVVGLRGPGRHGNGTGPGGEMPPATLGRLGDPHESSPMRVDGRMHQHRRHGSNNMEPPDRQPGHSMPYGRSQDDLAVGSPRPSYSHIMGRSPQSSIDEPYERKSAAGYYKQHGHSGHASDYYASNGSMAVSSRGHRPLQHRHSRDDLDALRPRKTRRTGPSFQSGEGGEDAQAFLASSPRRDVDGAEGFEYGDGMENGIPYLAAPAVSYAAPDEVPPAPPRRLVSRHNTPSRPERSGSSNNGGGSGNGSSNRGSIGGCSGSGGGSNDGSGHGHQMHLGDPNAMDAEDAAHPPAMGPRSRGSNFAAQGFFAAVSPVTVNAAYGGFPGGRRHRRNISNGGAQDGSGGPSALSDGYGGDPSGLGRTGPGWRMGEISPEEAAVIRGDSPASSRSGGGGGGSAGGGGGGMGGLGLTAHAMSRMEKVKASRHEPILPGDTSTQSSQLAYRSGANPNNGGHNGYGVGVSTLGEDLSQLDLGEPGADGRPQVGGGRGGGGGGGNAGPNNGMSNNGMDSLRHLGGVMGPGVRYDGRGHPLQQRRREHDQDRSQQQHPHHRQQPHYTQPLRDERDGGRTDGGATGPERSGGGRHKSVPSGGMGLSPGRRPTPAEAAELLRRRSSVDEVIGLLAGPAAADGSYDSGSGRPQQYDPAQFDSWRNSLTKVLGHLGFDFEDENGMPVQGSTESKRSPAKCISSRGASQYLSWGGASAMSFEDNPEEFHDSLRQIPMKWRSSLSSIMNSMASNGVLEEAVGAEGGGGMDGVDVGPDGKLTGERKRLEQQASLEMLQSVMRETLESMSQGTDNRDTEDGEAEAKAAAAAVCTMDSIRRANADGIAVRGGGAGGGGSGSGRGTAGSTIGNVGGRGGGDNGGGATQGAYGVSGGIREDSRSGMDSPSAVDPYYYSHKSGRDVGQMQGGSERGYHHHPGITAQGNIEGGGGMQHGEHHTSF